MDLGTKLQIRAGQRVAVLDAPADTVLELPGDAVRVAETSDADAVLVFVADARALAGKAAASAVAAAKEDRLTWLLYPKAGQLGTDLNRDRLAEALRERGVRAVRQISVDDVWSALRFRPAQP